MLLAPKIYISKLDIIEKMLFKFFSQLEELDDEHIMLSGVYELLHLVFCTRQLGPLNTNGCFVFEELNRKIVQMINGQDLVGSEFIKLFNILKSLNSINESVFGNEELNNFF